MLFGILTSQTWFKATMQDKVFGIVVLCAIETKYSLHGSSSCAYKIAEEVVDDSGFRTSDPCHEKQTSFPEAEATSFLPDKIGFGTFQVSLSSPLKFSRYQMTRICRRLWQECSLLRK